MNIVDLKEVGSRWEVTTDNVDRPVFVYPRSKFSDLAALKREINKSISLEQSRKATVNSKVQRVKNDRAGEIVVRV